MNKKKCILLIAIIVLMALLITACKNQQDKDGTPIPNGNLQDSTGNGNDFANELPTDKLPTDNLSTEVFSGQIASIQGDSILLMDANETAGDLYSQNLSSLELMGLDGEALAAEDLKPGMLVDISFSGMFEDTSPRQIAGADSLQVTGEKDDILGLYMKLVRDIYNVDPGLNSEIEMIVLNLTEIENLTPTQKSALIYMVEREYGYPTYIDTYDGLVEKGRITDMQFEKGILISFSNMIFKTNSFSFDLSKWRSGLGAYYFVGCNARKGTDGTWSYKVQSHAIS